MGPLWAQFSVAMDSFGIFGAQFEKWAPGMGPFFSQCGPRLFGVKKHEILKIHKTIQKTMDRPTMYVACGICFHEFMCFSPRRRAHCKKNAFFFFSKWAPIIFKNCVPPHLRDVQEKETALQRPTFGFGEAQMDPKPIWSVSVVLSVSVESATEC